MPDLLHARIEPQAAARIAIAEHMAMGVPDFGRVEPVPRGRDQGMIAQVGRQFGQAGIENAVAQREITAREQPARRDAGAEQQTASLDPERSHVRPVVAGEKFSVEQIGEWFS